jgi:hypothetical protein
MKKIWITLAVVLVVALIGVVIIIKMINKPHQNLKEQKPDVTIDAPSLVIDYSRDVTVADSSYLNKKLEVSGVVEQVTQNQDSSLTVLLTGVQGVNVSCNIPARNMEKIAKPDSGAHITVIGQCSGFLMDVVLNNTAILQK